MIAFIHPSPNTVDVCCIIAVVLFCLAALLGLLGRVGVHIALGLLALGLAAVALALLFIV